MGWLEFQRNLSRWQWNMLVPQLLDPIGRWYRALARVMNAGRVAQRMTWTPPRREMIQPKEEIQWLTDAVRAGFMSLSEVQRSFGFVPGDLLDELAEDLRGVRERGLVLSTDMSTDPQLLFAKMNAANQRDTPPDEGDGGDQDPVEGVTP